jgi:hypothetical protein
MLDSQHARFPTAPLNSTRGSGCRGVGSLHRVFFACIVMLYTLLFRMNATVPRVLCGKGVHNDIRNTA